MSATFPVIVDDGVARTHANETLTTKIDDIFCHYRKHEPGSDQGGRAGKPSMQNRTKNK